MSKKLDAADVTRTVRELLDELEREESDVTGTIDVVVRTLVERVLVS